MSGIAFCADVHIANHRRFGGPVEAGVNRRCKQIIDALMGAAVLAKDQDCDALVVLGDLFDTAKPEPQVIAAVQHVLMEGPPAVLLLGNHEQVSTAQGDHSLAPLAPVAHIVDQPCVEKYGDVDLALLPFQPDDPRGKFRQQATDLLKWAAKRETVLAFHMGVSAGDEPGFLRDARDVVPAEWVSEVCRTRAAMTAFAGNWHTRRTHQSSPRVHQVGALVPTGWDNPGIDGYGGVMIYRPGGSVETHVVPGPRFVTTLSAAERAKADGHLVYLRLACPAEKLAEGTDHVREMIKRGVIVDGEAVPESGEAEAATRTAAQEARSAGNLEAALAAFVQEMPLTDDVPRRDVLERCRRYLGC